MKAKNFLPIPAKTFMFLLVALTFLLPSIIPVVRAHPNTLGEVKIGVILPASPEVYDPYDPNDPNVPNFGDPTVILLRDVAKPEIDKWFTQQGLVNTRVTFDFRYANWNAQEHQKLVKQFKSEGVDLIIGGAWSSQVQDSIPFVFVNGMLLFSQSSTSPNLNIPNDGLFRMCPPDDFNMKAFSDMVSSYGIEKILIINQLGWLPNDFLLNFKAANKLPIIDTIIHLNGDVNDFDGTWDPAKWELQYTRTLQAAEKAASRSYYPSGKVGVVLFSNDVSLIQRVKNYPKLYSLNWFMLGSGENIQTEAAIESDHLHLYNTAETIPPEAMSKFNALQAKYDLTPGDKHVTLNVYNGYIYDIAWVIAKSVVKAQSQVGTKVISVLPSVSNSYSGVTGLCLLDRNGDRAKPYYDFLGFKITSPGLPYSELIKYGYADYLHGVIRWNRIIW